MRKIPHDKIKEIRGTGSSVTTEDGRDYIPVPARKIARQPIEEKQPAPASPDLTPLIEAQIQTMQSVAEYGAVVAELVAEMAKPKPKKNMQLLVGRDTKGNINTINVKEM
jgi:hypothetical protein